MFSCLKAFDEIKLLFKHLFKLYISPQSVCLSPSVSLSLCMSISITQFSFFLSVYLSLFLTTDVNKQKQTQISKCGFSRSAENNVYHQILMGWREVDNIAMEFD